MGRLVEEREMIMEDIGFYEKINNEIEKQMKEFTEGVLICKSGELVGVLRTINEKAIKEEESVEKIVDLQFSSEILPTFSCDEFTLRDYSLKRQTEEVIYSDIMTVNCLKWRLKIYPNGNGVARGLYISVFLELVEGIHCQSSYEYRIEMLSLQDNKTFVAREFASEFENGECWGYNRFYKIDNLQKEHFWDH